MVVCKEDLFLNLAPVHHFREMRQKLILRFKTCQEVKITYLWMLVITVFVQDEEVLQGELA